MLLGAGWSAGWYYVQGRVGQVLDEQIARLEQSGKIVECQNRSIEGFPFRIVINCPGFLFNDIASGFGFNFQSLKTAAQIYQPGKIVAEMQPVGGLNTPLQGRMAIDWSSLRASVFANLDGVDRFSLLGKEMKVIPVSGDLATAQLGEFQLHGRKADENDVQLAVRMRDVVSDKALWPDFDLETYVKVSGVYSQMIAGKMLDQIGRESGLAGLVEDVIYSPVDGGKVTLSGPFSVDQNGLVTGQFNLVGSDVPALIEALANSNPLFAKDIRSVGTMLSSVAVKNDDGSMAITLLINKGQIMFGLIPVGFLPPVY